MTEESKFLFALIMLFAVILAILGAFVIPALWKYIARRRRENEFV